MMGRPRSQKNDGLPKYVYRRDGNLTYIDYRGRKIRRTIVLGPDSMTEEEILRRIEIIHAPDDVPDSWKRDLLRNCRKNAKPRNLTVDISLDDVEFMLNRADGRCEVTGIPFQFSNDEGYRRRPWIPSIDRVDSSKGYHMDNCRIVCAAVNYALNEWGLENLLLIADRLRQTRKNGGASRDRT